MGEVKFSTKITVKDMFCFLIRHTYTSFSGIFLLVLSCLAFVCLAVRFSQNTASANILLTFAGLIGTVIQPVQLYMRAMQQVKLNPMFAEPLEYIMNAKGITVSQKEETLEIPWEDVKKVIETKTSLLIYLSTVHAYILPKNQCGEKFPLIKESIQENIEKTCCKWK